MEPALIVLLFAGLAVAARLFAGQLDRQRVEQHVRGLGGELVSQQWTPFGTGWFGSQNERLYQVRYRDRDGDLREATVKTSMLAGVYFTEDRLVREAEAAAPSATTRIGQGTGTYMVLERFKPGRREEVYRRLRDEGRSLPPGVSYVDSWVAAEGDTGFQLVRSESPEALQEWTRRWEDLVEFDIVPVVSSAEAARAAAAGDRAEA